MPVTLGLEVGELAEAVPEEVVEADGWWVLDVQADRLRPPISATTAN
jgi:hypothetical protein